MKKIKWIVILLLLLIVLLYTVVFSFNVDVNETDIPRTAYEENASLMSVITSSLTDLFVTKDSDEYTLVENIMNYVIVDSIRENINEQYNPFSDCNTDDCLYIFSKDQYYLDFIWAELNDDNQIIVNVSAGTDVLDFHTIAHFYFDVDIDYLSMEITLELDHYKLNEKELPISYLDQVFGTNKQEIEESVTFGTLDLEEYKYVISFSIFDLI